jgi:glutathione S-transferase
VLDDGRTITDSTIISEYIEEVYPEPPPYPKDPYERARMRTIEDLCDRSFDAVGFGFWLSVLREEGALPSGVPPKGTHYGKNCKEMARVAAGQLLH